jgi:RNA polymerase sigma factor (sigma-70 family)
MCIVHPLDPQSPTIFACAQAGCETCTQALLECHEGLVHTILHRQWRADVAYADLLQEGRIGLWRAIVHFDAQRGVAFSSYAGRAIERRMWRAVFLARRQANWQAGSHPPAGVHLFGESADPLRIAEDSLWWAQVCATLGEMVSRLPEHLQEVIVVSYGLDGGPPRSLAAIGRWYGVTREMVRVWRNQALVQLRMPRFSVHLRTLCGHNSRAAYARARALNRAWLGRRRRRRGQQ